MLLTLFFLAILLTCGEEMPATRNERVDIKGIGEVMIAAMTMSLISGQEFLKTCEFGNVAAGLLYQKRT